MNHTLSPLLKHFPDFLQQLFQRYERHETNNIKQVRIEALNKNETLTLSRPADTQIECFKGCVWVTQDGDLRDIMLEAGQNLSISRPARVLVHALESSQVNLRR